ncbi:MAG: hypothetical protein ACJA16_004366 [Akkermansiaceae bacterium]|jgi:hypothetical protein
MPLWNESPNPGTPEEMTKVSVDIVPIAIGPFELGIAPLLDVALG